MSAHWIESDYVDGIQTPHLAFDDAELKAGAPEMMGEGLPFPKARTGNFASVYKMFCGGRCLAVRCFARPIHQDLRQRYSEIGSHLRRVKLPYFVEFTYLDRGFRVGSEWRPILKMEWTGGETIRDYVERNLRQPSALRTLADKWIRLLGDLRREGIAHGDLQHGNVLIVGGELKLIDYDGMYVRSLEGYQSREGGHPNYQHPQRGEYFGAELDNFSGLVVLLSIVAVAHDPEVWARFKAGDDCLLFRDKDFREPAQSRVFAELLASRNSEVRAIAQELWSAVGGPVEKVPSAERWRLTVAVSSSSGPGLPQWVAEDLRALASMGARLSAPSPSGGDDWVRDHLGASAEPSHLSIQRIWFDRALLLAVAGFFAASVSFREEAGWAATLILCSGGALWILLQRFFTAQPHVGALYFGPESECWYLSRIASLERERSRVIRQRTEKLSTGVAGVNLHGVLILHVLRPLEMRLKAIQGAIAWNQQSLAVARRRSSLGRHVSIWEYLAFLVTGRMLVKV